MKTASLRTQINARILLTSLLIVILGGFLAIWQARNSVKTELDSSLKLAAQLIQINFVSAVSGQKIDVDAWLPRFVSLDQTRHLRVQLKRPGNHTLNFSGHNKADNEATPPDWFVYLISAKAPKIEQQLSDASGNPINLIVEANPIDEISEAWQECRAFFATLGVMTAFIFLVVNLLFNKAFKAIAIIVEALQAIERGDYRQKLPDFPTQEYDAIAKATNHLIGVLDAANQENKALTSHSLHIQEEERRHLAKELHDELGQSLTAIKVMAAASKQEKSDPTQIADTIISVCDHLIGVVRSMMRNLHPLVLSELGLKAGLEDLLNHWKQRCPELSVTLNCPNGVDRLDQHVTIQVFRVVQECLTNTVRHAQAEAANVRLELVSGKLLRLEVSDNGKGFAITDSKKGFGLLGVRERIKSMGGTLAIESAPQFGMKIIADIPL